MKKAAFLSVCVISMCKINTQFQIFNVNSILVSRNIYTNVSIIFLPHYFLPSPLRAPSKKNYYYVSLKFYFKYRHLTMLLIFFNKFLFLELRGDYWANDDHLSYRMMLLSHLQIFSHKKKSLFAFQTHLKCFFESWLQI